MHRTTRELTRTDAGQQYFQRMQVMLGVAEEVTQAVAVTRPRRVVVRIFGF